MIINFFKIFHSNFFFLHNLIYILLKVDFKKFIKIKFINMLIHYLLWIIYKGECITSYYYKLKKNVNYKLGDNIYNTEDYAEIFKQFNIVKEIIFILILSKILNYKILFYLILLVFEKNKVLGNYIFSKRLRYFLFIFIYFIFTDNNLLNEKILKKIFIYVLIFVIFIIIVNYFELKKRKETNIIEITLAGIFCCIIIMFSILYKLN